MVRRDGAVRSVIGPIAPFVAYLAIGGILLVFLFSTVHRRSLADAPAYTDRFHRVVQVWIEHGYFKHGGLAFTEPGDANPQQTVWRSSSMAFLQGAHLLERINYLLRGSYSYRLMTLHNQFIILLTAAILGLLTMRIALRLDLSRGRAFLLGVAALAVYQTFPQNLAYFWELLPTAVVALLAAAWLLLEEARFERNADESWANYLRTALIFLLAWVEPVSAFFMVGVFLLSLYVLAPGELRRIPVLRSVALPAVAGVALIALQVLWVEYRFPAVTLEGSGFLFRTGLDGSTQYVQGHWDLLTRKWPLPDWPINFWKVLFVGGVLATLLVVRNYLLLQLHLRSAVFVLAVALGLYVPLAFTFFQAVAIHPYGYDIYLLFPLVLALFGVAPAALEDRTGHTGIFVLVSVASAWCFAWVHLRTYAMQFPLK